MPTVLGAFLCASNAVRAKRRRSALSPEQWSEAFDDDDGGCLFGRGERIIGQGVDPHIRAEVWPFLLGLYELDSTASQRALQHLERREVYEGLRKKCQELRRQAAAREAAAEAEQDSLHARGAAGEAANHPTEEETEAEQELEAVNGVAREADNTSLAAGDMSAGRVNGLVESLQGVQLVHDKEGPDDSGRVVEEEEEEDEQQEGGGEEEEEVEEEDEASTSGETIALLHERNENGAVADLDRVSSGTGASARKANAGQQGNSSAPGTRHGGGKFGIELNGQKEEDFEVWQRIMRLDAVRMNAAWVPYAPSQATVSEEDASVLADYVGLTDDTHLEPSRRHHAARLVAILEAYALVDPDIGYCQGMSDLLSPFVALINDDAEAFFCFRTFMERARQNFRTDEVGIRRQLARVSDIVRSADRKLYAHLMELKAEDCIFVYRMVVVLLRRELSFEQTLCLWEVTWADALAAQTAEAAAREAAAVGAKVTPAGSNGQATKDLLLYVVAAIVLSKRKVIIEKCRGMDEVLRLCNSVAGTLDIWQLVDAARELVRLGH
eukprot:SM000146S00941  [mRNA]  locus=s146:54795:57263:- [translate_table: standard]